MNDFDADFGFTLNAFFTVCFLGGGLCCFSLVIRVNIPPPFLSASSLISALSDNCKSVSLLFGLPLAGPIPRRKYLKLFQCLFLFKLPFSSKAVADGAIGFYCDHHVSARMSKFMYGVEFLRELNPNDPDHVARKERLCELPSGPKLLPDAFDCILARVSFVSIFSKVSEV